MSFYPPDKFDNDLFKEMSNFVRKRDIPSIRANQESYFSSLLDLIDMKKIPYDGIYFLLFYLIDNYKEVSKFYTSYYENIFIDEFQDSNTLAIVMINNLFKTENREKRFYFGDSLQTIFEFSGADPKRFQKYKNDEFKDFYYELKYNYRFRDNQNLKKLENLFRRYYLLRDSSEKVEIKLNNFSKKNDESNFIRSKAKELFDKGESSAVLLGNKFGNIVNCSPIDKYKFNSLNDYYFFNCLFEDENDSDKYFTFCTEVNRIYEEFLVNSKHANLKLFLDFFEKIYSKEEYYFENNYILLLKSFISNYLLKEVYYSERERIFLEVIKNYQLIKFVEYVEDKVPIISIHKSKGLEWDNIFIVNANKGVFGGHPSSSIDEDLRLFYVSLTRAKKEIFFSSNNEYKIRHYPYNNLISDFFNLPFIILI